MITKTNDDKCGDDDKNNMRMKSDMTTKKT